MFLGGNSGHKENLTDIMIGEFLKSRAGIVLLSIIWGLGLATLFKKSCVTDGGKTCAVIEFRGPTTSEAKGIWNYGGSKCYQLQQKLVSCK